MSPTKVHSMALMRGAVNFCETKFFCSFLLSVCCTD